MLSSFVGSLPVHDGSAVTTLSGVEAPTVFTGLQDGWRARTRWTTEYFRRHHADLPVPIRQYAAGAEYDYTVTDGTLGEFLDYWENVEPDNELAAERCYLAEWNFVRDCPSLLEDFAIPPIFSDDWLDQLPEQVQFGRMWLFFGEPGCSTGLHCDTFSTSAWLAVLSGTKTLRFVAPEIGRFLQSGDSLWSDHTCARIFAEPNGQLYEVTLRQGETLYIPGDWYHEVRNPERNLMLTANFVEKRKALSFLAQFESRLTEPIDILRQSRNDHVRLWVPADPRAPGTPQPTELDNPAFRASQLAWVRERTAALRAYEQVLRAWSPAGSDVGVDAH